MQATIFEGNIKNITPKRIEKIIDDLELGWVVNIMQSLKWYYGDDPDKIVDKIDVQRLITELIIQTMDQYKRKGETTSLFSGGFRCGILKLPENKFEIEIEFIPVKFIIRNKSWSVQNRKLINGEVPPHSECPFRETICSLSKICEHKGIHEENPYSCSIARGLEV